MSPSSSIVTHRSGRHSAIIDGNRPGMCCLSARSLFACFWRESRRHVTLFLELISARKIFQVRRKWRHGNFSVTMNTSSSAPFQEERLVCAFTPWEGGGGVVHVKIQTGMLVQFFGFEIWANPFLRDLGNWCFF